MSKVAGVYYKQSQARLEQGDVFGEPAWLIYWPRENYNGSPERIWGYRRTKEAAEAAAARLEVDCHFCGARPGNAHRSRTCFDNAADIQS